MPGNPTSKEVILRTVNLGLRFYLGGVFLYACFHKIMDPAEFALSIASYQILPLSLVNIFAVTLPWIELFAGLGIILGFRTRENSLLITGMMVMFISVIAYALSQELAVDCGCFASQEAGEEMTAGTLARDAVWLAIAAHLFFFEDGKWGIDGLVRRVKNAA